MSKTVVILLDAVFPFGQGETFLESEIPFLKAVCNELIIAPTATQTIEQSRVKGLVGVKVIAKEVSAQKWERALCALTAVTDFLFWKEVAELLRNHNFNKSTLKILALFISQGNIRFRQIRKELKKLLSPDDHMIFYSYWLDTNAYICGKLHQCWPESFAISRAHRFDIYLDRNACGYIPLRNEVFSGLDAICPISVDGVAYLGSHYPLIKQKLYLARLGTANHGLNKAEKSATLRIVSCSNMIQVKRIERIIQALAALPSVYIEWTHFGSGLLGEELQNTARINLSEKVKFNFAGAVENSVLMKWYFENSVDVFVNTSESEGIPVSIMEAMSFGIPCVATNVGGTSEIVEDGVNGYLLSNDEHTSEKLAQKLLIMQKQSEQDKSTMRKKARDTWEEKYSAEKNYSDFYKHVLNI